MGASQANRGSAAKSAATLLLAMGALAIAAALFGGCSGDAPIRLAIVELCAIPAGALAAARLAREGAPKGTSLVLTVLALALLLPMAQLTPLPPSWWMHLPGGAARTEALRLAGGTPGWRSISLSPRDTSASLLALVPPAAMFLGTLQLDVGQIRRLTALWIGLAMAGLALGAVQLAGGSATPAYLYKMTNAGSLVGFFANRNHEASLLLALIPMAGAFLAPSREGPGSVRWGGLLAGAFLVLAVVGLGIVRSRAGVILALPATIGAVVIAWAPRRSAGGSGVGPAVGLAMAGALASVALFAAWPIVDRLTEPAASVFRFEAWPPVARAALSSLPFGAGMGAFDRVYRAVEPVSLLRPAYFNHAHNDYLEGLLEGGILSALILSLFVIWFAGATVEFWRRHGGGPRLARAATISVTLLLAQSLVDYPLRTTTLSTLFAFCCGVMARPEGPNPRRPGA